MFKNLLTYLFLIITSSIFSQNFGSLTGKVIDNETGFPLEGATIRVEDSDFFAVSDQNGFFQILDLPTTSYNVTASFIGFKSQTKFNIIVKSVGNQSLDYTLNPLSDILDEVILTESPFKTSIDIPAFLRQQAD